MSQIIQRLDQQQLKSLCGIVAHTSEGLTKSELTTLLGQCGICSVDDGSSRNQLGYTIGLNKRDWLYNCLVTEINKSQSFSRVFSFLQAALNPASYTSVDSRQKYRYLFEETNKRLRETDVDKIRSQSLAELNEQIEKLCVASQKIISLFKNLNYQTNEQLTAREEAKARLRFFKHIIEDCDGYKNLYTDGKQIAKENDLQRLFRFVWYGTSYKVDAEPNNGRGQADFIVSMGQNNQNIVEFKLASNSTLSHVFTQVKIYEAANCTDGSLIAIFCFSESEYLYSEQVVKAAGYEELLGESIYLIDCRNDNKKSASIA